MGASTPTELILASIGQGVGDFGSAFMQAQADRAFSDFERRALIEHAGLTDRAAQDRIRQGQRQAQDAELRGDLVAGAQRANLAAQGVDIGSGTAALLQEETRAISRDQAQSLRINAFREALGMKIEGAQARSQAGMIRSGSKLRRRVSLATGGLSFARNLQRGIFEAEGR